MELTNIRLRLVRTLPINLSKWVHKGVQSFIRSIYKSLSLIFHKGFQNKNWLHIRVICGWLWSLPIVSGQVSAATWCRLQHVFRHFSFVVGHILHFCQKIEGAFWSGDIPNETEISKNNLQCLGQMCGKLPFVNSNCIWSVAVSWKNPCNLLLCSNWKKWEQIFFVIVNCVENCWTKSKTFDSGCGMLRNEHELSAGKQTPV